MIRELVLAILVLLVCGPLSSLAGLWAPEFDHESGVALERERWHWIWVPLVPAAIACSVLVGWAIQEPSITDELVDPIAIVVALFFGLLWVRAGVRALRSLRARAPLPAETRGLIRPRIHIAPELVCMLDHDAATAVYEHEAAHARHLDPLRIWIAQFVTDLQFPSRPAKQRLTDWLVALEVARDEEARRKGADGAALATAIIAAARICPCPDGHMHASASIQGTGQALRARVQRLLAPLPTDVPKPRRWDLLKLAVCASLFAAIALGVVWGDEFVHVLPGVRF